jgi:hypothetical protein
MKVLVAAILFAAGNALAGTVGQPAPEFTLADVSGKPVKLSDYRGSYVVLEWVNPECPYVEKHYGSANMQGLQKEFTAQKVVWLAINSTREGHYEYYPPQKMAGWMKQVGGAPSATLLDPTGKVGRAYQARTTPHMYIVDPKGVLVYAGSEELRARGAGRGARRQAHQRGQHRPLRLLHQVLKSDSDQPARHRLGIEALVFQRALQDEAGGGAAHREAQAECGEEHRRADEVAPDQGERHARPHHGEEHERQHEARGNRPRRGLAVHLYAQASRAPGGDEFRMRHRPCRRRRRARQASTT